MNGQKKSSKREIVDKYIDAVKPYEKPSPINFDLRAYAAYVAEHKLDVSEITQDIMAKFVLTQVEQ